MKALQASYWLALAGYFGLLALLVSWTVWLAPSSRFPVSLVLLVSLGPLLLPLRPLLDGRPRAHLAAALIALLYLVHGISEAFASPPTRLLASLEIVFSTALFLGATFHARLRAERDALAR